MTSKNKPMYSVFFTLMPFCLKWIFGFFSWDVGLSLVSGFVLWGFSGWTAGVRQWEDSSVLFCWSLSLRKASHGYVLYYIHKVGATWRRSWGVASGMESINRMGPAEWDFALVSQDTAALSAPSQSLLVHSVVLSMSTPNSFFCSSKSHMIYCVDSWVRAEVRLRREFYHSINVL